MYAIVDIAGKQYKVKENDKIYVSRLDAKVGDSLTIDNVLLVSNDDDVQIGLPNVDGASVSATVVDHVKGDKITVFKKKRRKGYRVTRGHRQPYTQIEIGGLSIKSGKDAASKRSKAEKTKKPPATEG